MTNTAQQGQIPEDIIILGIESSCDETAASVVKNGRTVLSDIVYSQIQLHVPYGGVVPEIASRSHIEKIDSVVHAAINQAGIHLDDISALAVTQGPGLVGALLVGVNYAKGLAYAIGKPLIAVNHIMGHISANFLAYQDLELPFLCLVVSGGHSHLVAVKESGYTLLGCTQDDAAGEAFDKAARVLGLPYPGGPNLDKLAQSGDAFRYLLPTPKVSGEYDYSFSGLKTAFINLIHGMKQRNESYSAANLAASFQKAVVDQLCSKAIKAAKIGNWEKMALAGGVAANSLLRKQLSALCQQEKIQLFIPPLNLCGDNAAMIAAAAYPLFMNSVFADLELNADPALSLQFSF